MNAPVIPASDAPRPRPRRASGSVRRRGPLARRRRQSRVAARERAHAHTRKPLTAEQLARELPRRRSPTARALAAIGAIFGSAAAHAAIVAIGIVTTALTLDPGGEDTERVKIELQDREELKKEPEPPPPEPEPEPEKQPKVVTQAPVAEEPKVEEQPEEAPEQKPLRVVGLSLESTAGGGDGPAFAVGNTRMGETSEVAEAPTEVKKAPKTEPARKKAKAKPTQGKGNRAATRIPTAKAKIVMPKVRSAPKPTYPSKLKSQGIEGNVIVLVTVDEKGKVTSVKLIGPAPYPEFNEAARASAMVRTYEPATRDGVPFPYTMSYTVKFRIEE